MPGDDFGRQLSEAFEMVDDESAALEIVTRAIGSATGAPTELLVTNPDQTDLHRIASHPTAGGPGCPVDTPFGCVAVRRGAPTVFNSSESLNACPKLAGRPSGPCSAVCIPVTFMGRASGVLHATGPVGEPPGVDEQHRLVTLASLTGARLGTVRAFSESQEQATTDPLTGLFNRRAIETKLSRLNASKVPYALAMADLDHFKMLNDSHGHEAGDRALTYFSDALREACRAEDVVGRWGGEEFVAVFVGTTLEEARDILERLREQLADKLTDANAPRFTSSFGVAHSTDHLGMDDLIRAGRHRPLLREGPRTRPGRDQQPTEADPHPRAAPHGGHRHRVRRRALRLLRRTLKNGARHPVTRRGSRRGDSRRAGPCCRSVVRGRHFNDVAADELKAAAAADDFETLRAGQPADLGRARARRNRRVEAVDVEA